MIKNNTNIKFRLTNADFVENLIISQVNSSIDGVSSYNLEFQFNDKPKHEAKLIWNEDVYGISSIYIPTAESCHKYHPSYRPVTTNSSIFLVSPLIVAVSSRNTSVLNISISDCLYSHKLSIGAKEVDGLSECAITFFSSISNNSKSYSCQLRIDHRDYDFNKSLKSVTDYLYEINRINTYVPKHSYEPLYSTWYNFHRNIYQDELLEEMKEASKYGFKTVIIDDGWQLDDKHEFNEIGQAYDSAGDWKISKDKFYDFPKFVDDCHKLGIKVILWLAVSLIGFKTDAYKRFEGKYLYERLGSCAAIIDPRYKECREYLINSFSKVYKDNNLDGLKLDFIDTFNVGENAPYKQEMDIASLEEAVYKLTSDIKAKLSSFNKDVLIEYRQNYTSPMLLENANMVRVSDCPIDFITNYSEIASLRLTTKVAVHSDMVLYNLKESNEQKARHLYSTMFSVPQISMKLVGLNEVDQLIIKNYMNFYQNNGGTLMNDRFMAYCFDKNYILCENTLGNKKVAAVTSPCLSSIVGYDEMELVNLSGSPLIPLELEKTLNYEIEVISCLGEIIHKFSINNQSIIKIAGPDFFIAHIKVI